MAVSNYQELQVWQKAMDLAVESYGLIKKLPKEEVYSLSDQIRRASVSIPSNIAEGNGRQNPNEFKIFLRYAKGSAAELETQLLLCQRIGYLSSNDIAPALALLTEISKMLSTLVKSCSSSRIL
jgi:four helix bundle protein